MDRKAVGFYAVAASASLGVLLSAGCGTDNTKPAKMVVREARPSKPASVVVVSPEASFIEPGRPSTNVDVATEPVASASEFAPADSEPLVDPYAELATEATPVDTQPGPTSPEAVTYSDDSALVTVDEAGTTEFASVEDERVEPTASANDEVTSAELRFADGPAAVEPSDAEKTIAIRVGPKVAKAPSGPHSDRLAAQGEVHQLTPLLVTPRRTPGEPTPARPAPVAEPNSTAAQPAPIEVAAMTPRRVAAEPRITKALKPVARPAAGIASGLAPATVTAAGQPAAVAAPSTGEPKLMQQQSETAPASPVPSAEPTPEPTPAVVQRSLPPAHSEPAAVLSEAKPRTTESGVLSQKAEPTPSPSALRVTEVQVAPVPLPAASEPLETVAAQVAAPQAAKTAAVTEPIADPAAIAAQPAATPPAITTAPASATPPAASPKAAVAPEAVNVVAAPARPAPVAERPAVSPAPVAPQVAAPVAAPVVAAAPRPAAPAPAAAPQPAAGLTALPAAPVRSPAMVATLAQADERVRHAIQLAEKGAMYASRKEFTSALTLISQARDVEFATRQYSQATAAGLQALKEANDFVKPGAATADISRLVAGHKTPVLKGLDVSDLPATLAAQHYFDYAKVQLANGIGRETVGSIALYGLARIIVAGAGPNGQQLQYTGPAMALYQAALICEPQNFRAAHELGVLLATTGQLELARNMLLGSASLSPQSTMYKNLAVVHARLGETQLAAEAQQKATVLEQTSPAANVPPVQWVDPATFAHVGSATDPALMPPAIPPAAATPAASAPPKKPSNVARARSEWNPLNLRR